MTTIGITTSESKQWDAKTGGFITSTTQESFLDYPMPPTNAIDISKTYADGKFTTTYKTLEKDGAYNYQCQSTVSTEPLKAHPAFSSGGEWELSTDDLNKIKKAESGEVEWSTLSSGTGGLAQYAQRASRGQDSFLMPSISLHITEDEDDVPDLSELGKIANLTNAPQVADGVDWLLAGCTFEALTDGKWRVTREYRASGSKGWDAGIYS